MKCGYPGYKKYSTQNTTRMQKGWAAPWNDPTEKSRDRNDGGYGGSPKWISKHIKTIFHILIFNLLYLWSCIISHQLYTQDVKTKLDPRVLNFCFSHSTSWCFRQRRQGRTSMASSCTSNATDCNVMMPRGVARSTGQTTSTWDWAEGNAGFFNEMPSTFHSSGLLFQGSGVPQCLGVAPVKYAARCWYLVYLGILYCNETLSQLNQSDIVYLMQSWDAQKKRITCI